MHIAHPVDQGVNLLVHHFPQPLIPVPQASHRKSASQIEEAIPICVPDIHPFRSFPKNRELGRDEGHIARLVCPQTPRQVE